MNSTPELALTLEPMTEADLPALTELWYSVFNSPGMLKIFPDTPGVRRWVEEANRHDLVHRPDRKYMKVVNSKEGGKMVAYAKWDLSAYRDGMRCEARFPPWHKDMDAAYNISFFARAEHERKRVMGKKKHYCQSFFFHCILVLPRKN